MLQVETSNEMVNTRYTKLLAKLKNKISRYIQEKNLDVDFQLDINENDNIINVIIINKSLTYKVSQVHIISIAKIIVKETPEKFDVKIYFKLGENLPDLVLSLNEETKKHYYAFDRIERVFTLKDRTVKRNRTRMATVNVLRRERLSKELRDELDEQELTRRKLYLEERSAAYDWLHKTLTALVPSHGIATIIA
jgi:hypothetical protein